MFILLTIFFNCLNFMLLAQTLNPREYDYSHVDSIALNISKSKYSNVPELAKALTKDLKKENKSIFLFILWSIQHLYHMQGGARP